MTLDHYSHVMPGMSDRTATAMEAALPDRQCSLGCLLDCETPPAGGRKDGYNIRHKHRRSFKQALSQQAVRRCLQFVIEYIQQFPKLALYYQAIQ